MRKIWLIIKREYVTRVRTKAFLWGTIALPLLTIGVFAFQIIMSTRQLDHTLKLAILDDNGGLAASITRRLTGKLPSGEPDRKSTRLNSSHRTISYAVFCLKK